MYDPAGLPPMPSRRTTTPFPAYSYVPNQFPHPRSNPAGHSFGKPEPNVNAEDKTAIRELHDRAVDLFNHGYYWESHEAWEAIWHAFGRTSPTAVLCKGLIKLAAAGVKARQRSWAGVERHAARASELLRVAGDSKCLDPAIRLDVSFTELIQQCSILVSHPDGAVQRRNSNVVRVIPMVL
ncbi:hypothetical protein Q31b_10090 [Novipirellula aureliae]|uniref:DUF309 domain-containing protein n=1 Tax=Novipirellula aureliae TaxID=2527966 RepID=A0A5C6E842_9BACT|nr:DUF309 domain-containing protein [Novipirellula aureliae]TWU45833.1 hypothetical protein Q31b_10090 [Novipirellula aureliae]